MLSVTQFDVCPNRLPAAFDGFRVVHLSDLHGACFGRENELLYDMVRRQRPDIIVATGDMLDSRKEGGRAFLALARRLVRLAPVFSIRGNHEENLTRKPEGRMVLANYENALRAAGVTILLDRSAALLRGGEKILLYGLVLPTWSYKPEAARHPDTAFPAKAVARHLGVRDASRCSVLLAHSPIFFPAYAAWGADLVLSGHMHGGVIRLPKIGGLLSPYRRFFPQFDAGLYKEEKSVMLLSRGLGGSGFPMRIADPPEIVAAVLHSSHRPPS